MDSKTRMLGSRKTTIQARREIGRWATAIKDYRLAVQQFEQDGKAALLALRCGLKLTQRQMASDLGIHFSYLSKIENGHAPLSAALILVISKTYLEDASA